MLEQVDMLKHKENILLIVTIIYCGGGGGGGEGGEGSLIQKLQNKFKESNKNKKFGETHQFGCLYAHAQLLEYFVIQWQKQYYFDEN